MSLQDVRDSSAAQSQLAMSKRVDDLVLALASAFRMIEALVKIVGPEDLDRDQLLELAAVLHDHEHRDRILSAAQRLGGEDPGAWFARQRQAARNQPRIAPRGTHLSGPAPGAPVVAVDIDPRTGQTRKWHQSPVQPNELGGS
jgi:hypothetical protein